MPIAIQPIQEVVDRLRGKRVVPTRLRSAELARLPLAAREEAFFSSGVENARFLDSMKKMIDQELAMLEDAGGTMSKGRFVVEAKARLGALGQEDSGQLTDIGSRRRLELIHDFQIENVFSKSRWKQNQNANLRDEFPCQELVRVSARRAPRDWTAIWQAAGGKLYQGRMIAPVDDPIWTEISRFDKPWPPFDYGSGMGVEKVSRAEAEALGVIAPGEDVSAPADPVQERPVASVAELGPDGVEFLRRLYGDAVQISDGVATLVRTVAAITNRRTGYHEWNEADHPRDEDGKFSSTGAVKMGNKSLDMALRRKADVRAAMMHNELGKIDFVWGRPGHNAPDARGITHTDGYGISHIQAKHPELLSRLPEIIAKGEVQPHRSGNPNKVEIHFGTHVAILGRKDASTHYALTAITEVKK